ncbi:hypothetical protein IQ64_46835 [Streptomyces stelliscabiei]|uniref:Uncharacterized protein n=1 Tax=Streptomyces stelliscabiei TaxID=146820 RepID=A0A8I0TNY4_9ACTN|nr:hypothetical protein IQ64_46835 [Streptomyces stelliscabiei]MBE1594276.1 hypothetical protein [Streptomyces stelliscabiei]
MGEAGRGRWNLDLGDVVPELSLLERAEETAEVALPRFDEGSTEGGSVMVRGLPVRRVGGRLVTTVFDLLLAQYGVARLVRGHVRAVHPRMAGDDHLGPGGAGGPHRPGVRPRRRAVRDRAGCRHQPLVPLRHHLPRLPGPDDDDRLSGCQRRRLGALPQERTAALEPDLGIVLEVDRAILLALAGGAA